MEYNHLELYHSVCTECSRLVTKRYSTSFSLGIRMLDKSIRDPIYSIYGFVRFADEIVDTFHDYPKEALFNSFKEDTWRAIRDKISLNPILHSFQGVVNQFGLEDELITAFLQSMETDLYQSEHEKTTYEEYIYGSAEVVGLMTLRVFCAGDNAEYHRLKPYARSLGAAFQKVNFLRDLKSDYKERGRVYFPNVDFANFSNSDKKKIEEDIQRDFDHAAQGIVQLPPNARFGVYIAYKYYLNLFHKICCRDASEVTTKRIRVNDFKKLYILMKSAITVKLRSF
ncbi:MAG: phytoene/squalene synthase family protein [Saprospirales bacterium]|nr:MAG: phytoene/squalene synthase family protein [Saprospirales bacterium]